MSRPRLFDHDEAVRLYETGEFTYEQLGERFGVTASAISQAVWRSDPEKRERMKRYAREFQRRHHRKPCKGGCGRLAWHGRSGYCTRCRAEIKFGENVRADALRCTKCGEWKPDEAFHLQRGRAVHLRRGRKPHCRACESAARQDWRERNRDRDNAAVYADKRRRGHIRVDDCDDHGRCRGCGTQRLQPTGATRYHRSTCPLRRELRQEVAA